nr:reverse transcriptase domain-containing protein [Tanacetum cinerariifolium]
MLGPEYPPTPKFVPEPVYPEFMPPEDDVLLDEEQLLPAVILPTTDSPRYILESDPKDDPEEDPKEDDKDHEEDPTDCLNVIDDDDDDEEEDEEESPEDDANDEEEDEDEDGEEEEEHPASADSVPPPVHHVTARMSILSPPLPISSPPLPASPTYPLGHRVLMIRPRAEAPYTSHPLPSSTPPLGTPPLLPIPLPTSSPPFILPSKIHIADILEVAIPPQKRLCIALGPRFEDEMVGDMLGIPATNDVVGLSQRMTDYVTTVSQDINEIYERLDDAQDDKLLMSDQFNMLRRDRRADARVARLIKSEAILSHEAWVHSMDASDTTRAEKMTNKYYPRDKIKKLEVKLWNLKVRGTDMVSCNQRFQELALMCARMFPKESDKIERYIDGLSDMIYGSVMASKPKTMQDEVNKARGAWDTLEISSPFEGLSDIGSPRLEGPPLMPEDPYAYVVVAFLASPLPDHVPGPEEPEQAPPLPVFVLEPVYPEFMLLEDKILPSEEQLLPAAVSPTIESPRYITNSDLDKDPEEDPNDYPADGGDDDDDDDGSFDDEEDDDDDVEENKDEEEDEDEEEEEHPALVDSIPPLPVRHTTARTPPSGTPSLLPIPLPTSSPPFLLPSTSHKENVLEVTLLPQKRLCIALGPRFKVDKSSFAPTTRPTRGFRANYGFVAILDDEIRRDPERDVGYGITDMWDEMLVGMQGAPTTDETELGRRMTDFVTTVKQDTDEIYGTLDDAYDDRAWVQSMDASDIARAKVVSLRTTLLAQQHKWQHYRDDGDPLEHMMLTEAKIAKTIMTLEWVREGKLLLLELALMCARMFPKESDKIERNIGCFPDMIYESVMASKPKTMQDKKQNQQQNKKQNTGMDYTTRYGEKKPYGGFKPLCSKCNYHQDGQCAPKCHKCNMVGHLALDCRSAVNANTANNQKGTGKVKESFNVTFDETPLPSKTSPLVDDDLDEDEAIKITEKKNLENDIVDETLEIDEIVNIKESRNHPLENVIRNLNQITLRSQAQNQSNLFCFISTIEPKNVNEALRDESWIVVMQEELY